MNRHASGVSEDPSERGHEQTDLSIRLLFSGLVVLVVVTVMAVWGMSVLFGFLQAKQANRVAPSGPLVETGLSVPEPRLETSPSEVRDRIDALRATQGATYAWLDRRAGIARIPVSRAVEILAERGLPYRPAPEEQP